MSPLNIHTQDEST